MPYKKRYKKIYNKRGRKTSVGRVMCAGKQKTATIKTNEKYYSEIDKFHQEAKDKYYSNNSNPAEYEEKYDEEYDEDDEDDEDDEHDEDVALAKAISLSLNVQNIAKAISLSIKEPKPVESKVSKKKLTTRRAPTRRAPIRKPITTLPGLEEKNGRNDENHIKPPDNSQLLKLILQQNLNKEEVVPVVEEVVPVVEEVIESELPKFFTITGTLTECNNPKRENDTLDDIRNKLQEKNQKLGEMNRQKEREIRGCPYGRNGGNNCCCFICKKGTNNNNNIYGGVITENELIYYTKLQKEVEDLEKKLTILCKVPLKIWKLKGSSSPSEVFPYIVIDEFEDLETNISYFIEENPEYFVSQMKWHRSSAHRRKVEMAKFMLQKRY